MQFWWLNKNDTWKWSKSTKLSSESSHDICRPGSRAFLWSPATQTRRYESCNGDKSVALTSRRILECVRILGHGPSSVVVIGRRTCPKLWSVTRKSCLKQTGSTEERPSTSTFDCGGVQHSNWKPLEAVDRLQLIKGQGSVAWIWNATLATRSRALKVNDLISGGTECDI